MKMRKVGSLVLILALLVSLVGCGGSTQNSDNNQAAPTP